jgi:hypothetical protein
MITADEISGIVSALAAILATMFSFYQHRNNRGMTKKLEEYKRKLTEKMNKDSESAAIIYGELWDGLHRLSTDRIYILQPHPSHANRFLTITMEVRRSGVSSMKPKVQSLPMSDVPRFVAMVARERFISYPDVATNAMDKRMRAIMGISGVLSMSIYRLENADGKWIGNIFCEHTQKLCWNCNKCEKTMAEMAKVIQPILPDYEG